MAYSLHKDGRPPLSSGRNEFCRGGTTAGFRVGKVSRLMGNVQIHDEFLRMTTFELAPEGTEVILLVEDEDVFRKYACAYLKSEGYSVLEASNGGDALEICRSYNGPIHVLITDIVMLGMGGAELARAVLKLRPALAVIFISGYAVSGYVDRALTETSGSTFVQKPFSFDVLNRALKSLLDKNNRSE